MSRRYGSFQVLAAAILWGTTGPVQVLARLPVAPAAVGGMRILAGGLVLLAWTLARRGPGPLATLARQRRHWRPLLAASCATGVFQAAYFTSVSRTGAALATAIVFGVAPVTTGLAARIIGRSPLGWGWAAGTGCAIAGCVLLLLPGRASRVDGVGVVLAIVAAGCYAVYTVSAKRLADDGAAMAAAVSITLIAGGLLLTPWLVAAGPGLFSGRALLTAAWLGPVTTAVAYMLFVRGLRTISAAAAGTLSLAEPLVAALATAIVFGVAPVTTGLAARIIGRAPLGWGWAAGTGCAVAGCVLLLLPAHASRADGVGVVLAVLAAGCYAVYTVSAKRLADDGAAMPAAVSITLIAGGLLLTPWLVAAGPGLFSGRALLTAAWLGPVTTAAAYMLFVQGLRTVSAATAGTLSLAEPLVAALAGIGLLHEHLTAPAVIGCGLLAAGLAFASLQPSRRRARPLRLALARGPGTGAVAGSAPDAAAGSR